MQVVENWADVRGQIVGIDDDHLLPAHAAIRLRVDAANSVEGFPNLLDKAIGQTLTINLEKGIADKIGLRPGQVIAGRVRLGGPNRHFFQSDQVAIQPT